MKRRTLFALAATASLSSALVFQANAQSASPSICPSTYGVATGGCNEELTLTPGGSLTVTAGVGTTYDGSDDALVGFLNNSGSPVTSLTLNGNGVDIFGFDGDGVDTFGSPGNSSDTSGYGGPDTYFTNISPDQTMGTVNFLTPIADDGTTYFSLEEAFTASTPVTGGTSVTPEPNSLLLLGTGVLGIAGMLRRRLQS